MATVINVRKCDNKSETAQIIKDDLSLWMRDGWEQYGVEAERIEQTTISAAVLSSLPLPRIVPTHRASIGQGRL